MQLFNIYIKAKNPNKTDILIATNMQSNLVAETIQRNKVSRLMKWKTKLSDIQSATAEYVVTCVVKETKNPTPPDQASLILSSNGDPSVGDFGESWVVPVPFNVDQCEWEDLEMFRESIRNVYKEFSEYNLKAEYDYEIQQGE